MKRSFNRKEKKVQRKELRSNGTKYEATLWLILKNRQIDGVRFRRQFSVGEYILDFYCPELKLGIELDGQGHYTIEGSLRDGSRDNSLSAGCDRAVERDCSEIKGFWSKCLIGVICFFCLCNFF